jgi:hypothetical protein
MQMYERSSSGAQNRKREKKMKKISSIQDLAQWFTDNGASSTRHDGCIEYSIECGPSRKQQAASALKKTQLNNRVKKERKKL